MEGISVEQAVEQILQHTPVINGTEEVELSKVGGRILAQETVSCPPAIPIAVSGEEIDGNMIRVFEEYGIRDVSVVK